MALPGLGHPSAQKSRRLVDRAKRASIQGAETDTRVASCQLREDARIIRPHQQQVRLAGDQLNWKLVELREEVVAHIQKCLEFLSPQVLLHL